MVMVNTGLVLGLNVFLFVCFRCFWGVKKLDRNVERIHRKTSAKDFEGV